MQWNNSARMWATGLGILAFGAFAPAQGQGWRSPTGSAEAVRVVSGGVTTRAATAVLPVGGGVQKADEGAVGVSGLITAGAVTSVTSGSSSTDRTGVQGVATASSVSILNGRIVASRVIAISTLTDGGNKTTLDGDGSGATDLVIDGASYGESVAPNTRVELPGAGYVILNEQVKGKGRGTSLTVNMIHVYLTGGGEVVVGSVTSGNGT
jgi:hypothetical protein